MPSVQHAQLRMLQPLKPADRKTLLALLTQLVDLNNEASRARRGWWAPLLPRPRR